MFWGRAIFLWDLERNLRQASQQPHRKLVDAKGIAREVLQETVGPTPMEAVPEAWDVDKINPIGASDPLLQSATGFCSISKTLHSGLGMETYRGKSG